jgi:peptidoglycan/xylan/chitin deacetylase (PgdA/CDA1 family)
LHPELVHQAWLDGNAIGNHTYNHEWVPGERPDRLRASLEQTTAAIRQATGDPCVWLFRPPYGYLVAYATPHMQGTPGPEATPTPAPSPTVLDPETPAVVASEGLTAVDWDTEAKDWLLPAPDVIAQRIITQLHPGAIILLHDGAPDGEKQDRSRTVAALPAILQALKAKGLHAVTLPQLLLDEGLDKYPDPHSSDHQPPQSSVHVALTLTAQPVWRRPEF